MEPIIEATTDTPTVTANTETSTPTAAPSEPSGSRRVSFPRSGAAGPARRGPGGPRSGGPGAGGRSGGPGGRGGRDSRPPRREVVKPEYDSKTILVRRVTRVVTGGRRFSFSVAVVIGNKMGSVGVGVGKAGDTGAAIQKAYNDAKKNMIKVNLTKTNSIAHSVDAKSSSARCMIMPNSGKGLVAGSSLRTVLELAGIADTTAKIYSRSRNKLNNARSAIAALRTLQS
jgi:small subunit ribosomal protein S5